MDSYLVELENAQKALKAAEHMLTMMYDVINDPKLFVTMAHRLFSANVSIMRAILIFEYSMGKIPAIGQEFEQMFDLFRIRTTRRYSLNMEYVKLIEELHTIVEQHNKSPVTFKRKQNYVICDDNYNMQVLTKQKLADYLEKTKSFITDAQQMINRMKK